MVQQQLNMLGPVAQLVGWPSSDGALAHMDFRGYCTTGRTAVKALKDNNFLPLHTLVPHMHIDLPRSTEYFYNEILSDLSFSLCLLTGLG